MTRAIPMMPPATKRTSAWIPSKKSDEIKEVQDIRHLYRGSYAAQQPRTAVVAWVKGGACCRGGPRLRMAFREWAFPTGPTGHRPAPETRLPQRGPRNLASSMRVEYMSLHQPEIVGESSDLGDDPGSFIHLFHQVGPATDLGFDAVDDIAGFTETDIGGNGPLWRVGILIRGLSLDEGIEDREVVPADGDLVGGLDTA